MFIDQAAAVREAKLADLLKDLGAAYPETKVLENKLEKLVRMKPAIEASMGKLDELTTIPVVEKEFNPKHKL